MGLFTLIAGPCAIEDFDTCMTIAEHCKALAKEFDLDFIFKGSYKKANRTKLDSFSSIGEESALGIMGLIGHQLKIKTITDVHDVESVHKAQKWVDYLQIPAFLCRQTELLIAAGKTGKGVNIKKGQFASPESMEYAYQKVLSTGNKNILLTERGTTFGYNYLVTDMTSIPKMRKFCDNVIMDCTHSVQIPNQSSGITGGDPEMIETMALSAIASGASGLFIEVHPHPYLSSSDAGSILELDKLRNILEKAVRIKKILS